MYIYTCIQTYIHITYLSDMYIYIHYIYTLYMSGCSIRGNRRLFVQLLRCLASNRICWLRAGSLLIYTDTHTDTDTDTHTDTHILTQTQKDTDTDTHKHTQTHTNTHTHTPCQHSVTCRDFGSCWGLQKSPLRRVAYGCPTAGEREGGRAGGQGGGRGERERGR
jgi:hypothetical protein